MHLHKEGLQLRREDWSCAGAAVLTEEGLGVLLPSLPCFEKCSGGSAPTSTEGSSVAADDLIPQLLSLLPTEAPMATNAAAGHICRHQDARFLEQDLGLV